MFYSLLKFKDINQKRDANLAERGQPANTNILVSLLGTLPGIAQSFLPHKRKGLNSEGNCWNSHPDMLTWRKKTEQYVQIKHILLVVALLLL